MIRQIWAILVLVPGTMVVGSMVVLASILQFSRSVIDGLSRAFSHIGLLATLTRVKYVVFKSDPHSWAEQLVLVSNHESHLDSLGIQTALNSRSIRYVAKESLFKIPFFGWALKVSGNVPVRKGAVVDRKKLNEIDDRKKDRDVLFFAEGTRSRVGEFQAFKKGAFYFAITHKRSILPIAVCGGFECLKPDSLKPLGGELALCVGKPIDVDGYDLDQVNELMKKVRNEVEKLRQEGLKLIKSPRLKSLSRS